MKIYTFSFQDADYDTKRSGCLYAKVIDNDCVQLIAPPNLAAKMWSKSPDGRHVADIWEKGENPNLKVYRKV